MRGSKGLNRSIWTLGLPLRTPDGVDPSVVLFLWPQEGDPCSGVYTLRAVKKTYGQIPRVVLDLQKGSKIEWPYGGFWIRRSDLGSEGPNPTIRPSKRPHFDPFWSGWRT